MTHKHKEELNNLMENVLSDERFDRLNDFMAHGRTSIYDHSMRVARLSFLINERLRLKSDKKSLVKGALLHDYYLYDWHVPQPGAKKLHGFSHAEDAMKKAHEHFGLTKKEANIVYSHMWPLNITHLPKSKEAWIVCLADKICSLQETIRR